MARIDVFVCHCGLNIASTVDVDQVVDALQGYPGVVVAADYPYMCSEPGQALIQDAIRDHDLDGVVVAACSPLMHESTFRKAADGVGLNPYRLEIANIREQIAWSHQRVPPRRRRARPSRPCAPSWRRSAVTSRWRPSLIPSPGAR